MIQKTKKNAYGFQKGFLSFLVTIAQVTLD